MQADWLGADRRRLEAINQQFQADREQLWRANEGLAEATTRLEVANHHYQAANGALREELTVSTQRVDQLNKTLFAKDQEVDKASLTVSSTWRLRKPKVLMNCARPSTEPPKKAKVKSPNCSANWARHGGRRTGTQAVSGWPSWRGSWTPHRVNMSGWWESCRPARPTTRLLSLSSARSSKGSAKSWQGRKGPWDRAKNRWGREREADRGPQAVLAITR